MAKVVEISGTPGAGKSTLIRELTSMWKETHEWVPAYKIFPKEKTTVRNFKSFASFIYKLIKGGNIAIDSNAMREAGDRFMAQNADYMDACWQNIATKQKFSYNGLDLRFKKAGFLYTTIQQVQIILENPSNKYALIDEGLIHKITSGCLYKSNNPEEESEELVNMMNVVPLPSAMVFIDTDIEETLKRLNQRKRVINMHKSLTKEEILEITLKTKERMITANKILERKKVPILYLDAQQDTKEKADKINSFIQALSNSADKQS